MASQRFERGSQLAWALERGGGYRTTVNLEWQFVDLGGASSRASEPLDVGELVGKPGKLPQVSIEPTGGGRVRVSADEPLVFWTLVDDEPSLASETEEVDYGTVARVGPLLLAPLDDEQYASVEQGRMSLREPPLMGGQAPQRDSGSDLELYAAARQRLTRAFTLSFLGAAGIALAVDALLFIRFPPTGRSWEWTPFLIIGGFKLFMLTVSCAPLLASMIRWRRTPGAWTDAEAQGRSWPLPLTVTTGAFVLYLTPWVLGTATSAVLTLTVCQPRYSGFIDAFISASFVLAFFFSIILALIEVFFLKDAHIHILKWYGPASRFLRDPASEK